MRASEITTKPHLYLDMDGVQADFFTAWARLHGKERYKEIGDRQAREQSIDDLNARGAKFAEHFFKTLPPLPGGQKLIRWLHANKIPFTVLSAPLRGNEEASIAGKRYWLNKHNPGSESTAIFTGEKQLLAQRNGQPNVLVDDFKKYIRAWSEAGGIAILYRDANVDNVIAQLAEIYGVDQETQITEDTSPAEQFIHDVYAEYPQMWQNNHVMPFSEEEFAMFELKPSIKPNAVDVYWFQAWPQRQGIGSRAMKVLQDKAREYGVGLTLITWDKGRVSQAALTKFYKRQGFKQDVKGSRKMSWDPETVNEVFDQPYPVKWEKSEYGSYDALAKLPDGTYLNIMFNNEGDDEYQIEFHRNNSQSVTGEGDAQRVFATVLDAIQQFLTKFEQPWRFIFSASKEVEPGQNVQSRAKLYDRLIQRYAGAWGYDVYHEDHGDQITYELTRWNKVDENFADGKKPGRKGLAKRMGVDCKQSVTKLRSIAKNSTGERARMAHWCANMKSGRKK